MSEAPPIASYERTSSQRLKDALAILEQRHPLPRAKAKHYVEFRVMDALHSKFLAVERYVDASGDQVPTGISGFSDYFREGVILPDGEVVLASNVQDWRMSMFEYHGGWYITSLVGLGVRPTDTVLPPGLWGRTIADINDDRLRSEVMAMSMERGYPVNATYETLLAFVHEAHRQRLYRSMSTHESSIVTFCN